jgi:NifU-like protein involved in Fe-S cluster formation
MKGEIIYEYGKNPVNWGRLKKPDFSHKEKNISCGEEVEIDFVFGENDVIQQIGFIAEGRLVTIAGMSLLSEEMEGKRLAEGENISKEDILEMLEVEKLSPRRLKSALLGLLAMRNAYRTRNDLTLLDFGDLIEE